MSKLYYRYGTMGASKTAQALMLAYNFREKHQNPLLVKPSTDTRNDTMWSRIGIESNCITLEHLCNMTFHELSYFDCIIVDEVQFALEEEIDFLCQIVDFLKLPVFTYGLKTDFAGHLFPGSKRLFEVADEIEESKTVCWCGKSAKFNARLDENKKIIKDGDKILMGADEKYVALCRTHYLNGKTAR